MLRRFFLGAAMIGAFAGIVRASAQDDITAGLQKLADSPNYTWKTTTQGQGNFGGGESVGKTQKDGLTTLTITRQDQTYDVVIQGDKGAAKTQDGWKSASELAAAAANAGGGGGGNGPSPERILVGMIRNFKSPVATAQAVVPNLQNVQQSSDVYAADMSDDDAKKMLTFRRRQNPNADPNAPAPAGPTISNAKASVKFWIDNGAVSKMETHVTGTISFNGNDRDIDRTTTVEFSDVGSTTISVPDDVKAKMTAVSTQPQP